MNLNNIPPNTKWLDALKTTWSFITTVGSSLRHFLFKGIPWLLFGFMDGMIGQILVMCIVGIWGGMFMSWLIAKALYPVLPVAMAESIKAAQQKDFAMSHEFFTSTPELYLSVWVFNVGGVIIIVGWVVRKFLAHIFRPKDLLDKVASTEKELKAVQEELRQMKNAQRNTPSP
jgi:multidrug efflux pump subunit AcrB